MKFVDGCKIIDRRSGGNGLEMIALLKNSQGTHVCLFEIDEDLVELVTKFKKWI